jgi:hypothetical protein
LAYAQVSSEYNIDSIRSQQEHRHHRQHDQDGKRFICKYPSIGMCNLCVRVCACVRSFFCCQVLLSCHVKQYVLLPNRFIQIYRNDLIGYVKRMKERRQKS